MPTPAKPLSTLSLNTGALPDPYDSPNTPLYDTAAFRFASTQDLLEVVEGQREGYLYTRHGMNPSIRSLEAKLASLDGVEATLASGVGLVFFETPSHPRLEVLDIGAITAMAHAAGALVTVDNTFASSASQRLLELGADFAMQSATKYLGGHSNLTAGVLSATGAVLQPVVPWRKNLGRTIAPEMAHKRSRCVCTPPLRIQRHNANALAKAKMLGFGGMVTFKIAGNPQVATAVIALAAWVACKAWRPSRVTTSHHDMSPGERARRGISDAMTRLSIGLEEAVDLIDDPAQALEVIAG